MIRQNWFDVKGDETLALDWPLTEDSHVWEIGGFEGRWAQQIWDKFRCNIRIFEPQYWAVQKLRERFYGNDKIEIRPYGLWVEEDMLQIGNYHTDGASLVNNDGREPTMPGYFKQHYHEIQQFNHKIDLCLMNIEGAEYRLLSDMIASGIIMRFHNFFCQFHPDLVERSNEIYEYICREMGNRKKIRSLDMIWDCYPHAVAWRRK